jgi:hypothetical protein
MEHFSRERVIDNSRRGLSTRALGLAALSLAAVSGAAYLFTQHPQHSLPYLPYLLLAACPLMHFFHHGRHR